MSQFADRIKENARESLSHILVFIVRLFMGTIVGLTIALTAQNMTEMSHLVFVFVVMLTAALMLRLTRNWGLLSVVILMLVLSVVGVLLKLYIHTSPVG
jgi:hypothetical protein